MADPFTPKFVDLVRNYTTTTGTGDFKLGPVVNGYSGFTTACQVGDAFYYSAIGVDKPAEREVGRGTLLANGFISRSPVIGAKTNFTNGTKSIALIAAAEWYNMVQAATAAGSNAPTVVATRAALAAAIARQVPALLTAAGREGLFVWDASNLSAMVSADPLQAIYVAPSSDPTGASGAWVRKFTGRAEATWWGVSTAETAANNNTYFAAALATLKCLAIAGYGYNQGSIGLHTPAGRYQFNNSITIDHAIEVSGDYTAAGGGTVFEWTAAVHGFVLAGFDGSSVHSNGAKIKGFYLYGNNGGSAKHAIKQTGYANIENIFCHNWSGNGIDAYGNPPSGLSNSRWTNIMGHTVGWTLKISGGDSNGCISENIGGSPVRFGAILDASGIGCHHIGGVCNSAGAVAGYITRCEKNGHIYMVAFGQEAWCSTNSPTGAATSNQGWLYLFEGASTSYQPTWATAQTWYFSSPYCVDPTNNAARSRFEGHYVETGINAVILNNNSTVAGGQYLCPILTNTGITHGGYGYGAAGWYQFAHAIVTQGPNGNQFKNGSHLFGPNADPGASQNLLLQLGNWGVGQFSTLQFLNSGVYAGQFAVGGIGTLYSDFDTHNLRTKSGTAIATLTSAALNLGSGVALQFNGTTAVNSSGVIQAAAMPAHTGDVTSPAGSVALTLAANAVTPAKMAQVAALSFLANPTGSLANLQAVTLAGGLAFSGTTLTLGAITPTSVAATGSITSSGGGIGYATGAGGTVIQATSKSTGVTINKLCGQVTTAASALAANTGVSFAVTNSQIAATDTIDLVLASGNAGAGTYNYQVDKVSAGSFVVWLKNISAASLSEALVFNFSVKKAVNV